VKTLAPAKEGSAIAILTSHRVQEMGVCRTRRNVEVASVSHVGMQHAAVINM
jgi:hypothetical protein